MNTAFTFPISLSEGLPPSRDYGSDEKGAEGTLSPFQVSSDSQTHSTPKGRPFPEGKSSSGTRTGLESPMSDDTDSRTVSVLPPMHHRQTLASPQSQETLTRSMEHSSTLLPQHITSSSAAVAAYRVACETHGVLPHSSVVAQLKRGTLTSISLENDYIGERGILPLVEVLLRLPVVELNLRNAMLKEDALEVLTAALENHPTLSVLDLRENTLTLLSAQRLLRFVLNTPSLKTVHLNTNTPKYIAIQNQCDINGECGVPAAACLLCRHPLQFRAAKHCERDFLLAVTEQLLRVFDDTGSRKSGGAANTRALTAIGLETCFRCVLALCETNDGVLFVCNSEEKNGKRSGSVSCLEQLAGEVVKTVRYVSSRVAPFCDSEEEVSTQPRMPILKRCADSIILREHERQASEETLSSQQIQSKSRGKRVMPANGNREAMWDLVNCSSGRGNDPLVSKASATRPHGGNACDTIAAPLKEVGVESVEEEEEEDRNRACWICGKSTSQSQGPPVVQQVRPAPSHRGLDTEGNDSCAVTRDTVRRGDVPSRVIRALGDDLVAMKISGQASKSTFTEDDRDDVHPSALLRLAHLMVMYAEAHMCSVECVVALVRYALFSVGGAQASPRSVFGSQASSLPIPLRALPTIAFSVCDVAHANVQELRGEDITCALTVASLVEDIEGVRIDPYMIFAAGRHLAHRNSMTIGMELRHALDVVRTIGAFSVADSPFSFSDPTKRPPRAAYSDWSTWPVGESASLPAMLRRAFMHRHTDVYTVDGIHSNLFDSIRAVLWATKHQRRAVAVTMAFSRKWLSCPGGVLPSENSISDGFLSTFKIVGQADFHGSYYLIAQSNFGTSFGSRGFFYFPQEVVNTYSVGNAYIIVDSSLLLQTHDELPIAEQLSMSATGVLASHQGLAVARSLILGRPQAVRTLLHCIISMNDVAWRHFHLPAQDTLKANDDVSSGRLRSAPDFLSHAIHRAICEHVVKLGGEHDSRSRLLSARLRNERSSLLRMLECSLAGTANALYGYACSAQLFWWNETLGLQLLQWITNLVDDLDSKIPGWEFASLLLVSERRQIPSSQVRDAKLKGAHALKWITVGDDQPQPFPMNLRVADANEQQQQQQQQQRYSASRMKNSRAASISSDAEDVMPASEASADQLNGTLSSVRVADLIGDPWCCVNQTDAQGHVRSCGTFFIGRYVCRYDSATQELVSPLVPIPCDRLLAKLPFSNGVACAFNAPHCPRVAFLIAGKFWLRWNTCTQMVEGGPYELGTHDQFQELLKFVEDPNAAGFDAGLHHVIPVTSTSCILTLTTNALNVLKDDDDDDDDGVELEGRSGILKAVLYDLEHRVVRGWFPFVPSASASSPSSSSPSSFKMNGGGRRAAKGITFHPHSAASSSVDKFPDDAIVVEKAIAILKACALTSSRPFLSTATFLQPTDLTNSKEGPDSHTYDLVLFGGDGRTRTVSFANTATEEGEQKGTTSSSINLSLDDDEDEDEEDEKNPCFHTSRFNNLPLFFFQHTTAAVPALSAALLDSLQPTTLTSMRAYVPRNVSLVAAALNDAQSNVYTASFGDIVSVAQRGNSMANMWEFDDDDDEKAESAEHHRDRYAHVKVRSTLACVRPERSHEVMVPFANTTHPTARKARLLKEEAVFCGRSNSTGTAAATTTTSATSSTTASANASFRGNRNEPRSRAGGATEWIEFDFGESDECVSFSHVQILLYHCCNFPLRDVLLLKAKMPKESEKEAALQSYLSGPQVAHVECSYDGLVYRALGCATMQSSQRRGGADGTGKPNLNDRLELLGISWPAEHGARYWRVRFANPLPRSTFVVRVFWYKACWVCPPQERNACSHALIPCNVSLPFAASPVANVSFPLRPLSAGESNPFRAVDNEHMTKPRAAAVPSTFMTVQMSAPLVFQSPHRLLVQGSTGQTAPVLSTVGKEGSPMWYEKHCAVALLPMTQTPSTEVSCVCRFFCADSFVDASVACAGSDPFCTVLASQQFSSCSAFSQLPFPFNRGFDAVFYPYLAAGNSHVVALVHGELLLEWDMQIGEAHQLSGDAPERLSTAKSSSTTACHVWDAPYFGGLVRPRAKGDGNLHEGSGRGTVLGCGMEDTDGVILHDVVHVWDTPDEVLVVFSAPHSFAAIKRTIDASTNAEEASSTQDPMHQRHRVDNEPTQFVVRWNLTTRRAIDGPRLRADTPPLTYGSVPSARARRVPSTRNVPLCTLSLPTSANTFVNFLAEGAEIKRVRAHHETVVVDREDVEHHKKREQEVALVKELCAYLPWGRQQCGCTVTLDLGVGAVSVVIGVRMNLSALATAGENRPRSDVWEVSCSSNETQWERVAVHMQMATDGMQTTTWDASHGTPAGGVRRYWKLQLVPHHAEDGSRISHTPKEGCGLTYSQLQLLTVPTRVCRRGPVRVAHTGKLYCLSRDLFAAAPQGLAFGGSDGALVGSQSGSEGNKTMHRGSDDKTRRPSRLESDTATGSEVFERHHLWMDYGEDFTVYPSLTGFAAQRSITQFGSDTENPRQSASGVTWCAYYSDDREAWVQCSLRTEEDSLGKIRVMWAPSGKHRYWRLDCIPADATPYERVYGEFSLFEYSGPEAFTCRDKSYARGVNDTSEGYTCVPLSLILSDGEPQLKQQQQYQDACRSARLAIEGANAFVVDFTSENPCSANGVRVHMDPSSTSSTTLVAFLVQYSNDGCQWRTMRTSLTTSDGRHPAETSSTLFVRGAFGELHWTPIGAFRFWRLLLVKNASQSAADPICVQRVCFLPSGPQLYDRQCTWDASFTGDSWQTQDGSFCVRCIAQEPFIGVTARISRRSVYEVERLNGDGSTWVHVAWLFADNTRDADAGASDTGMIHTEAIWPPCGASRTWRLRCRFPDVPSGFDSHQRYDPVLDVVWLTSRSVVRQAFPVTANDHRLCDVSLQNFERTAGALFPCRSVPPPVPSSPQPPAASLPTPGAGATLQVLTNLTGTGNDSPGAAGAASATPSGSPTPTFAAAVGRRARIAEHTEVSVEKPPTDVCIIYNFKDRIPQFSRVAVDLVVVRAKEEIRQEAQPTPPVPGGRVGVFNVPNPTTNWNRDGALINNNNINSNAALEAAQDDCAAEQQTARVRVYAETSHNGKDFAPVGVCTAHVTLPGNVASAEVPDNRLHCVVSGWAASEIHEPYWRLRFEVELVSARSAEGAGGGLPVFANNGGRSNLAAAGTTPTQQRAPCQLTVQTVKWMAEHPAISMKPPTEVVGTNGGSTMCRRPQLTNRFYDVWRSEVFSNDKAVQRWCVEGQDQVKSLSSGLREAGDIDARGRIAQRVLALQSDWLRFVKRTGKEGGARSSMSRSSFANTKPENRSVGSGVDLMDMLHGASIAFHSQHLVDLANIVNHPMKTTKGLEVVRTRQRHASRSSTISRSNSVSRQRLGGASMSFSRDSRSASTAMRSQSVTSTTSPARRTGSPRGARDGGRVWYYPMTEYAGKLANSFHGHEGVPVLLSVRWCLSLSVQRDFAMLEAAGMNALSPHIACVTIALAITPGKTNANPFPNVSALSELFPTDEILFVVYTANRVDFSPQFPLTVPDAAPLRAAYPYAILPGVNFVRTVALGATNSPVIEWLQHLLAPHVDVKTVSTVFVVNTATCEDPHEINGDSKDMKASAAAAEDACIRFAVPVHDAAERNALNAMHQQMQRYRMPGGNKSVKSLAGEQTTTPSRPFSPKIAGGDDGDGSWPNFKQSSGNEAASNAHLFGVRGLRVPSIEVEYGRHAVHINDGLRVERHVSFCTRGATLKLWGSGEGSGEAPSVPFAISGTLVFPPFADGRGSEVAERPWNDRVDLHLHGTVAQESLSFPFGVSQVQTDRGQQDDALVTLSDLTFVACVSLSEQEKDKARASIGEQGDTATTTLHMEGLLHVSSLQAQYRCFFEWDGHTFASSRFNNEDSGRISQAVFSYKEDTALDMSAEDEVSANASFAKDAVLNAHDLFKYELETGEMSVEEMLRFSSALTGVTYDLFCDEEHPRNTSSSVSSGGTGTSEGNPTKSAVGDKERELLWIQNLVFTASVRLTVTPRIGVAHGSGQCVFFGQQGYVEVRISPEGLTVRAELQSPVCIHSLWVHPLPGSAPHITVTIETEMNRTQQTRQTNSPSATENPIAAIRMLVNLSGGIQLSSGGGSTGGGGGRSELGVATTDATYAPVSLPLLMDSEGQVRWAAELSACAASIPTFVEMNAHVGLRAVTVTPLCFLTFTLKSALEKQMLVELHTQVRHSNELTRAVENSLLHDPLIAAIVSSAGVKLAFALHSLSVNPHTSGIVVARDGVYLRDAPPIPNAMSLSLAWHMRGTLFGASFDVVVIDSDSLANAGNFNSPSGNSGSDYENEMNAIATIVGDLLAKSIHGQCKDTLWSLYDTFVGIRQAQ